MKMFKSLRKDDKVLSSINGLLVDLPAPSSITFMWNFGSLLSLCLFIQIMTGLFLAMHYSPSVILAFESVVHITRDVNNGWVLRFIHMNGASFFFFCMYVHVFRGLYYSSFMTLNKTWMVGVTILLVSMATAFMGYVLPWGQMSFWGAIVITNLLSAIPYLGSSMVNWVWGGFSVDNPTLNRFFVFHFILPFVLLMLSLLHLIFLHDKGSNNPLGVNSNMDKIPFHPYFSWKDSITFVLMLFFLFVVSSMYPFLLGDPENFTEANPLVTPIHIQPEWYFLFAYAILRSIPNKLGGVVAFGLSIFSFYFLPFLTLSKMSQSSLFVLKDKFIFYIFLFTVFVLTWVGARPVEDPYILIGQIFTMIYFLYFFVKPLI